MIAPNKILASKSRNPKAGFSPKQKTTACPGCNKGLPRCCLCLLPLTCAIPTPSESEQSPNLPFDDWFTWCQTCRHGGHAKHLQDWFSLHLECPVADCRCKCTSI